MAWEDLTPKQRQFLENYHAFKGDSTKAYKATYDDKGTMTTKTASAAVNRLLKNVKLLDYIKEINKELEDESIMGIKEIRQRLTSIGRRENCELKDIFGKSYEGKPTVKESMNAMELLAKMEGAFVDKKQVEVSGGLPVFIRDDVDE